MTENNQLRTLKDLDTFQAITQTNIETINKVPVEQALFEIMQGDTSNIYSCDMKINHGFISKEDLKAEMIKWIKELTTIEEKGFSISMPESFHLFMDGEYSNFSQVKAFIMHFFNISEEEISNAN